MNSNSFIIHHAKVSQQPEGKTEIKENNPLMKGLILLQLDVDPLTWQET